LKATVDTDAPDEFVTCAVVCTLTARVDHEKLAVTSYVAFSLSELTDAAATGAAKGRPPDSAKTSPEAMDGNDNLFTRRIGIPLVVGQLCPPEGEPTGQ
jgi:hypothetical protein